MRPPDRSARAVRFLPMVALVLSGCGLFQNGLFSQNANPWGADLAVRQCGHFHQSSLSYARGPDGEVLSGILTQNASPLLFSDRVVQVGGLRQETTTYARNVVELGRSPAGPLVGARMLGVLNAGPP